MFDTSSPIGIFDSGVGGISVLRRMREQVFEELGAQLSESFSSIAFTNFAAEVKTSAACSPLITLDF